MYMLYINLDICNIYGQWHCCNMDLDICCNILVLVRKRKLAKSIIQHIYYYNQQHMFELTVPMRLDIERHKILISYLRRIEQDMFLHIDG